MKVYEELDFAQAKEDDLLVDPLSHSHPRLLRVLDELTYREHKLAYVFNGEDRYWLAQTKDGIVPFDSLDFARQELYRQHNS